MKRKLKIALLFIGLLLLSGIALSQSPRPYYVDINGIVHSAGYQFTVPVAGTSCLETDATGTIIQATGSACGSGGGVIEPLNQIVVGTGVGVTSFNTGLFDGTSLIINSIGPHAIGGSTISSSEFLITGTWGQSRGLDVETTLDGSNAEMHVVHIQGTMNQAPNIAYNVMANLYVSAPVVNVNSGTSVNNLASVFIAGGPSQFAPVGWALEVFAGGSAFGGYPIIFGSTAFSKQHAILFTGTFQGTSVGGVIEAHRQELEIIGDSSTTLAAGTFITNVYSTASSGTSEWDMFNIDSTAIVVNGTATVSVASSFTVKGPPTGGTKNLAMWIKNGISEFDDDIQIQKLGSPSGTAPGTQLMKFEVVAGTNSGTCKLIAYAGTSTTPTTVVDNVGGGC